MARLELRPGEGKSCLSYRLPLEGSVSYSSKVEQYPPKGGTTNTWSASKAAVGVMSIVFPDK